MYIIYIHNIYNNYTSIFLGGMGVYTQTTG